MSASFGVSNLPAEAFKAKGDSYKDIAPESTKSFAVLESNPSSAVLFSFSKAFRISTIAALIVFSFATSPPPSVSKNLSYSEAVTA